MVWLMAVLPWRARVHGVINRQRIFGEDGGSKAKPFRLIVGLAPGGGFDTYSRVIARHMEHFRTPAMVVDNMPGRRVCWRRIMSTKSPSRMDSPSATSSAVWSFNKFSACRRSVRWPKFEYLGVPAQDNFIIGIAKSTGITSVEQWKASGTVLKIGGVAPGGGTDDIPKILKVTLGLPLQMVSDYKGTGPVRLAFNAGEVHGISNSGIVSIDLARRVGQGEVTYLVQANLKPHPDIPNVPGPPI